MSTQTSVEHPEPPQDLTGIVGHRFVYTYANGWQYEMYVKNATTIDYRIHTGHVGGRWVKDQTVDLVALAAWIAEEYCSTPSRALGLMLAPGSAAGQTRKQALTAELTPAGRAALHDSPTGAGE